MSNEAKSGPEAASGSGSSSGAWRTAQTALMRLRVHRRIHVRKMMLAFFGQVFRISYPVTGLAGARGFVVTQVVVQRFDKFDAFT